MNNPRTLLNWLKWNWRGRPTELIVETAYSNQCRDVIEEELHVPDYLVEQYWRDRSAGLTCNKYP